MTNILELVIGSIEDKREWRNMKARAKALPRDYRIAYEEIQKYIWKSSGLGSIKPFGNLLDLFEEGVANGKKVLEITGDDVAAFVDEFVRDEESYFDKWRQELNRTIRDRIGK